MTVNGTGEMLLVSSMSGLFLRLGSPRTWPVCVRSPLFEMDNHIKTYRPKETEMCPVTFKRIYSNLTARNPSTGRWLAPPIRTPQSQHTPVSMGWPHCHKRERSKVNMQGSQRVTFLSALKSILGVFQSIEKKIFKIVASLTCGCPPRFRLCI